MIARKTPLQDSNLHLKTGWAEIGRRNGIENQSWSSGRHTKFLNGIETTRIEYFIFEKQIELRQIEFSRQV